MQTTARDVMPLGPQVTFGVDLGGRCTFSVGAANHAHGPVAGEVVGTDFLPRDDGTTPALALELALARAPDGTGHTTEGRSWWTSFEPVRDADGSVTGAVGVSTDITGFVHVQAEVQALRAANDDLLPFRALVETSSDFIAIAGLDGAVRYLNPAGRALVGMSPDVDVTTTTIRDYLTAEGIERSERIEQPAVVAHGHWEGRSTLGRSDGTSLPVEIASFLMHHPETGAPFALATVQRDITDLLAALRSQEDFITLVAHELRTPLASVKGYVEIARLSLEEADTAAMSRHLAVTARNVDRMQRLVEQILTIAGERRPRPDSRRPADLGRLVGQVAESARPLVEAAGLTLGLGSEASLPVALDDSFAAVVENLLTNATKYTPAGGAITVGLAREAGNAVLSVADTGPGIPAGERERVFEKFARGHSVLHQAAPGLGLGLYITRAIVRSHDGEITVEDRPTGGARFVVRLPLLLGGP